MELQEWLLTGNHNLKVIAWKHRVLFSRCYTRNLHNSWAQTKMSISKVILKFIWKEAENTISTSASMIRYSEGKNQFC